MKTAEQDRYPKDHTVPHTHKYEYSQGFPYGHEVGR